MAERPPARFPKWLLKLQVFLLRRRLIPALNRQLMVITTTGRKSGNPFSIPIGYVREAGDIFAFNIGGTSNWFQNVLANGRATLEIEGKRMEVQGTPIAEEDALRRVLALYQQRQPGMFERFFGAPPTAPMDEIVKSIRERGVKFMRFQPR